MHFSLTRPHPSRTKARHSTTAPHTLSNTSIKQHHLSTTMSPPPPSLLTLPIELRLQIYSYALTSLPYRTLYYNYDTDRLAVSSIGAGLLTTCRLLYEETHWLPLQLNKVQLGIPEDPSEKLLACVRNLKGLQKGENKDVGWNGGLSLLVGLVREKGWDRD